MKCFYHPNVDAVAVCKSCGRALCHDCSADVSPGIACKGKCEEGVATLNKIIQYDKTQIASFYQVQAKIYKACTFFLIFSGITFFVVGIIPVLEWKDPILGFAVVLGVTFFIFSYYMNKTAKQYAALAKQVEANSSPDKK